MEREVEIPENQEELRALVAKAITVGEENNRLIRRMITIGRIAFWFKAFVWAIVLGLPLLFFGTIVDFLQSHTGGTSLFGYPSPAAIEQFLGHGQGS